MDNPLYTGSNATGPATSGPADWLGDFTGMFRGINWGDVNNIVGGIGRVLNGSSSAGTAGQLLGMGGLGWLLNKAFTDNSEPQGYQGSVPKYSATRQQYAVPPYQQPTGLPPDEAISSYLRQPGLSNMQVAQSMLDHGVPFDHMARLTGTPVADVERNFRNAVGPNPLNVRRPGQGGITYFSPIQYAYSGVDPKTPQEFIRSTASAPAPAPSPAPAPTPAPAPAPAPSTDPTPRGEELQPPYAPHSVTPAGPNRRALGAPRNDAQPYSARSLGGDAAGDGTFRPDADPFRSGIVTNRPFDFGRVSTPRAGLEGNFYFNPEYNDFTQNIRPTLRAALSEYASAQSSGDPDRLRTASTALQDLVSQVRDSAIRQEDVNSGRLTFQQGDSILHLNPIKSTYDNIMRQLAANPNPTQREALESSLRQVQPMYDRLRASLEGVDLNSLGYTNFDSIDDIRSFLGMSRDQTNYAAGGPVGGLGSLPGSRFVQGPGDGVSDSIPVTMDDGRQGRLADGEFVLDARTVSEIGNGSSQAGAQKLMALVDRIHQARAMADRGKPSGADQHIMKGIA